MRQPFVKSAKLHVKRMRPISMLIAAVATIALYTVGANDAWARKKVEPPKLLATKHEVQDLYYGDVLFYFYQDDYFDALVRVGAALDMQRVPHHYVESRLLQGGLYLSFGEHAEAGRIFKELLNANVPDETRNRAWFYLAKVWYQRGYFADAEQALTSIAGKLDGSLESERQLLHAQVLMAMNRFDEALGVLNAFPKKDRLLPYARFNLGVALIREQRVAEGLDMLDEVGKMDAPTEELRALRDKANLALGFALLKEGRPLAASEMLQRVRLRGPLSNKALLGMGWADVAEERYQAALAPFEELRGRGLLDAAVQEAYLAVPYAYAQLSATRQAAQLYENAIEQFEAESARIDESIAAIRGGHLLDTILANDHAGNVGWYWQLKQLPDSPETRYLYVLLATNEFQEGLKNYRDLKQMQRNLATWSLSIDAFDNMIDTRRKAYEQRVPTMNAILDKVDLDAMEAHAVELSSRLAVIERDGDVVGLATTHEGEQWNKVKQLEQALRGMDQSDPATEEMREKLRMIRGVLYWHMNANYKARLWHAHKEARELQVAVKEARRRWTLIDRARVESPKTTDAFAQRVATLRPRVAALSARLDAAGVAQEKFLSDLAIQELQAQKERLAAYGVQAQFALAAIYDRAKEQGEKAQGEKAQGEKAPASDSGGTP